MAGRRVATAAVSVVAGAAVGCGADSGPVLSTAAPGPVGAQPATTAAAGSGLGADERATLQYVREEEKLARDVYLRLARSSGDRRFPNIAASEQRHFDAVGSLLARYGVGDPAAGQPAGRFTDVGLQRQYQALVARGGQSPAAALAVGRTIERMDLADLVKRRARAEHADVRLVLDRLAAGSRQHLAAFSR